MADIIPKEQLLNGNLFQGSDYGGVPISFFWVQASPGKGPRLHVHPYEEIFVIQEGTPPLPWVRTPSKSMLEPS